MRDIFLRYLKIPFIAFVVFIIFATAYLIFDSTEKDKAKGILISENQETPYIIGF